MPSLRAKRSNPSRNAKKEWIASSQALLAMTEEGLYSASDQATALFLMDCRVIGERERRRPLDGYARQ
jgi:hypothetical protein